jgi:hypothetical protein
MATNQAPNPLSTTRGFCYRKVMAAWSLWKKQALEKPWRNLERLTKAGCIVVTIFGLRR